MRHIVSFTVAALALAGAVVAWNWMGGRAPERSGRSTPADAPVADGDQWNRAGSSGGEPLSRSWGPIHFTDLTRESGIDFIHVSGDSAEKLFPAANGSGVAAVDFDLDGNVDLYFLTGTPIPPDPLRETPTNRCFRNLGDWHFRDVTEEAGLHDAGYSAGVAVGDFDNDGFLDLFINGLGPHRLYRNQGDGTFVEIGSASGVDDAHWGTSAAFLDYDADGMLDLYVCHYALWSADTNKFCGDPQRDVRIFCNPTTVEPAPHILFHNEGDGRFRDATLEAGVGDARGRGQGVVAADVNGDGRIDLYVGNDLSGNFLFLNAGGTFNNASAESGTASDYLGRNQAGMGVDAADMNRDGRLDLFVTTFEGEHDSYYENLGSNLFQEVSRSRGLAADSIAGIGWGTALVDFDLDGWPDIVVTNGHTDNNLREIGRDTPYEQAPSLWRNVVGRFSYVGGALAGEYFACLHVGRGLAVADLDNDGDLDLVITHQDAAPALLRNDCIPKSPAAWIRVQLVGTSSNRDAVGAELRMSSTDGDTIVQQIKGGGSYLSAHELRQILAVSDNPAEATLRIRWPTGKLTEITPLETGRSYRIIEP